MALILAQLALDAGDTATALQHARDTWRLATCDGPPDWTYKVAYEEAGVMVVALGAGDEAGTDVCDGGHHVRADWKVRPERTYAAAVQAVARLRRAVPLSFRFR